MFNWEAKTLNESKLLNYCPRCKKWSIPLFITQEMQEYLDDFGDIVDAITYKCECDDCKKEKR